jgi:ribosomal protein L11 methylase PrmA
MGRAEAGRAAVLGSRLDKRQGARTHLLDHPHIVSGREVLDVGSGSGIVAIASVKAGARKVVACDIDPQSWLIGQVLLCDAESAK